ncbi:hypothetical protein AAIB41_01215 [Brucella sp. BE17]|uniref:hypothetical protein n=1 Tax=Brucella sp. BE17 TaxID=3142977 RepID=UPI0031B9B01A
MNMHLGDYAYGKKVDCGGMTEAGQDRAIGRVEGKIDQIITDMDRARDGRKQQYDKQEKAD